MISVEEAEHLVQSHMPRWGEVTVNLENPLLLKTAQPLLADRSYPSMNRVTMDGIALSWKSYSTGKRKFHIAGVCPAGTPVATLEDPSSTCFEIMTGAALPLEADLIIPYEHLSIQEGFAEIVVDEERSPFQNVHRQGSDYQKGSCLLEAGSMMNAPHWGIAASLGYAKLQCTKNPKVKVIATGDELVAVENIPLAHQLRCSNAHAIKASLLQNGYSHVDIDSVRDVEAIMSEHYHDNKTAYDLLIYSGGVSKGKFDYLPQVWQNAGVKKVFHEVSQRPGKPLWFGVDEKAQTAVLGLPGNPLSSLICLNRYLLASRPIYARLDEGIHFSKNLTFFVPVKTTFSKDAVLVASPLVPKNSGDFSALAHTDGFIELPKEKSDFKAGESFRYYPWINVWRPS